ncbi:hypothetical protein HYW84_03620 [Candidatus Peregrinibacteria bacterium]|nr:hypothetical protein [Candidatus Peregrinibacteria bacterium]
MTIYLTKAERKLYDRLPVSMKKAWGGKVEEETGTAWETNEELIERADYLRSQLPPRLGLALEHMVSKAGKEGLDAVGVDDFPSEVLTKALLVLGAVGLTAVIHRTLIDAKNTKDLSAVASLSEVRHQILISNSLVLQR